ncbi:myelin-oligodendrocyte glycoprotein-like [Notothenia coriiceps]|uniref:Myelin-oligodendrocyte glycoprotein-like n=1 Tax=Notothenia coriiceps TaxID=8208 RepID=A0A6I9P1X1_9TELE|nr:PREDICTED: myelin-oligodendrocyte glycoprotein-like [Notothenia coriiceps]
MDLSVLAFAFPLLTFFRFSLVFAEEHNEGRPQLIGSSEPISAPLGGDVLLPCVVQPEINMENLTVMWWRPDIPVDPNRYVHLHHENQHQEDLTMPSYVGRTEMFADGLKRGNLSLQIRNLKLSDGGTYRCIIPMLGIASTIMLVVFEPISDDTLTTTQFQGNLQTPDPKQETEVKVGRHNWRSWSWFCQSAPCWSWLLYLVDVS